MLAIIKDNPFHFNIRIIATSIIVNEDVKYAMWHILKLYLVI